MKQRIVPLGYALSGGIITINEAEADTVREIAEQYLSGKSLKAIAEMLTAKHIEYMSGKTDWNRSRIGDAFRFDFAGAAVNVGLLLVLWRVEVNVVQLRMGDFVNSGL